MRSLQVSPSLRQFAVRYPPDDDAAEFDPLSRLAIRLRARFWSSHRAAPGGATRRSRITDRVLAKPAPSAEAEGVFLRLELRHPTWAYGFQTVLYASSAIAAVLALISSPVQTVA